MVLPFESYFHDERVQLERWSTCLIYDLQVGKTPCKPYDLNQGFPWRVFVLCILYCVGFLLFVRRFLAIPLGKVFLTIAERNAPIVARPESLKARDFRRKKFTGSFVEFVFYTAFFAVGVALLVQQHWNWPSEEWWNETPTRHVDAHLLIYALFYAARYCATFFSLVVLDPRKKDFLEMVVHHIVTIVLVCLATAYGYVRIATVVMVVFDAADPFLHMAKLFNYVKQAAGNKGPALSFVWIMSQITDIFLGCFALVFTATRIVIYSYIVYSVSYESYLYTNCHSGDCSFAEGLGNVGMAHHVSVVLIWIINFLQWYWFRLLVKVIYKTVVEGVSDDARSDVSEPEADDTKTKASGPTPFVPAGVDDVDSEDSDDDDGADTKKTK